MFGRDNEIHMCLRTLGRRRKSNPSLIGEPGGSGAISRRGILCVRDKGTNGEEGGGWVLCNPFRNKEKDVENEKSVEGGGSE